MTTNPPADAAKLQELLAKATTPNPFDWYFPWRVVPSDGKPIIAGAKSGNLFRGFIGTWAEADLIVEAVNALPALLDLLAAQASQIEALTKERDEALAGCKRANNRGDEMYARAVAVEAQLKMLAETQRITREWREEAVLARAAAEAKAAKMREALTGLLDACVKEFGWRPDACRSDRVGTDPECALTWGPLLDAHAVLALDIDEATGCADDQLFADVSVEALRAFLDQVARP